MIVVSVTVCEREGGLGYPIRKTCDLELDLDAAIALRSDLDAKITQEQDAIKAKKLQQIQALEQQLAELKSIA